jgi:hypothetical protein
MESVSPPFSATESGKRPFYAGHIEPARIRRVEGKNRKSEKRFASIFRNEKWKSLPLSEHRSPQRSNQALQATPLARP